MAFLPNFTATQVVGLNSKITFTDTSTGVDAAITSRRIYIQKADGTYLVTAGNATTYNIWALPLATPIVLDVLDKDYALILTVLYVDVNGATLYTKSLPIQGFTLFNEAFDYTLTQ